MLASALTPYYGRTLAVRILQTRYVTEIRAVRMCYRSLQATRTGGARHAHRIGPIPRSMPGGTAGKFRMGFGIDSLRTLALVALVFGAQAAPYSGSLGDGAPPP
jgi:hypothetical protein